MKIELLCGRTGVDFVQNRGDEIEVGEDEGLRMIAAGQAKLAGAKTETATKKVSTEKAVKK